MALGVERAPSLVEAVERRTNDIVAALRPLGESDLLQPSALPDWDRLTIVCHLRFGAETLVRLSAGAVDGRRVAYYPEGREQQRPLTLRPEPGEASTDVVTSLEQHSAELHRLWRSLTDGQWECIALEPEGSPDLGAMELASMALLRLTEVEVHGSDLELGLDDWSDLFVCVALPFRLEWLNRRRTNHRSFPAGVRASWVLAPDDGPARRAEVHGDAVRSCPASPGASADATIEGSSRDLLALLLGRPVVRPLRHRGDELVAAAFAGAFPGP